MYRFVLIAISFVPLIGSLIIDGGDVKNVLTTKTLVKRYGYPFEEHSVLTEDGYILKLHRIPSSAESNNSSSGQVAFLMHGLLASSSDWCISDRQNSLAYILADAGYDVWMGNARGNTYSRRHIRYNPDSMLNKKFWDFSWHQIGTIDLPTMLDFVRRKTEVEQVTYFGHSQGTTTFLVLNSMRPEYNKIFKSAHLLAPIAFMSNVHNKFMKLLGPIVAYSKILQNILGSTEVRPGKLIMAVVGNVLCPDFSENRILCQNANFLVSGFSNETVNSTIIPDLMASSPGGSSINQVIHYVQEFASKSHFRQWDYGSSGNLKAYNSKTPPDYPLEKITVPMFIYHSAPDNLSSEKDVLLLIEKLPTLVGVTKVSIPEFDHLAFMYTGGLGEKVHKGVMKNIASMS